MPILFNPKKKKGIFKIPTGGTQALSCAFSYSAASYTDADPDPTPTITGTSGGRFTSTAGVVINTITGEIDLSASTLNTYVITYTVRGKACTQSVEITGSFANTKSLAFDGVDDYIGFGAGLDYFDYTNNGYSVSFWMKSTSSVWYEKIVNFGANSKRFMVGIGGGGGKLAWAIYNGTSPATGVTQIYQWVPTAGLVNDGNWHHIVVTVPLNVTGTEAIIYVDNSTAGSGNPYGIPPVAANTISDSTKPYDGSIDEVSIFDYALTSGNVTTIFNSGIPTDLTSLNPVAWWRCGDNSSFKSPQILLPEDTNKDKVSNYSMAFDGVGDFISMGNVLDFDNTDSFSISAWFNFDPTPGGTEIIVSKNTGSGIYTGYYLWLDSGSNVNFALISTISGTPWNAIRILGTTVLSSSTWNHVLLTYDGSSNASGVKMFLNGNPETLTIDIDNLSGSTLNSATFNIGSWNDSPSTGVCFNGSIDEVAVWDNDQSANISTISATPLNDLTSLSPVGYWKLGEEATFSTNWTVPDSSVNSNDGTSANMTIEDREGNAPDSDTNALSYNMDAADVDTDVPS